MKENTPDTRKKIVLASASPRRSQLLAQLGLKFTVDPATIFEEDSQEDSAHNRVALNAKGKAMEIAERTPNSIIIGVDTVGSLEDHILEKPKDRADAKRMIKLMLDREHQVLSGLCVIETGHFGIGSSNIPSTNVQAKIEIIKIHEVIEETSITFSDLSEEELEAYLDQADYMDKAAAYAIQGLAAYYVKGIKGDYFNVVGLPIHRLFSVLKSEFDINLLTG